MISTVTKDGEATEVLIREMAPEEASKVAAIHMATLPDDFLPSLGYSFLANTFYPSIIDNPYADVLVSVRDGDVVGFVLVAHQPNNYLDWFVKNSFFSLAFALAKLTVKKPRRLIEALAIRYKKIPIFPGSGEIAEIAVDPEVQQSGIGVKLVLAVNSYLSQKAIFSCFTKTLKNNTHVISMYKNRWSARVRAEIGILDKTYVYLVWELKQQAGVTAGIG